jgi:hypothetical protein
MGKVAKPVAGKSGNAQAAEVVAGFTAEDFDTTTDGYQITIAAAKVGSLGTAIYKTMAAAREALILRQSPPPGLTLRTRKGEVEYGADGMTGVAVDVVFYYGDPTDNTDAKYIGAPTVAPQAEDDDA